MDTIVTYTGLTLNLSVLAVGLSVIYNNKLYQQKGNHVIKVLTSLLLASKVFQASYYVILLMEKGHYAHHKGDEDGESALYEYLEIFCSFMSLSLIMCCLWLIAHKHAQTAITLRKILKRAQSLQLSNEE